MRHHHHRQNEAQLLRKSGNERGGAELLQPRRLGAGGKLPRVSVGIFRLQVARHHDVIADRDVIKTEGLALGDDADKTVRLDQRAGGRRVETNLHSQRTFAITSSRNRRILSTVSPSVGPNNPQSKDVTPASRSALMSPTKDRKSVV